MRPALKQRLLRVAERRIASGDPSHDISHARRVLGLAERLGRAAGADLDVVFPAALFHDLIVYPKDDPRSPLSQEKSADAAGRLLRRTPGFPRGKAAAVEYAIRCCSFSKGVVPDTLEAKVLQDADGLEAAGAVAVMRTFASSGQMRRAFYEPADPFCRRRAPRPKEFALDLFYARLLVVAGRMHTPLARRLARRRTAFLRKFLAEFARELAESAPPARRK